MKNKINLILIALFLISNFSITQAQVGINTETPSETLDVNGSSRLRDLPQNGATNAIYTKADGTRSSVKDQTFTATKTVVSDNNGVLGVVNGLPSGSGSDGCGDVIFSAYFDITAGDVLYTFGYPSYTKRTLPNVHEQYNPNGYLINNSYDTYFTVPTKGIYRITYSSGNGIRYQSAFNDMSLFIAPIILNENGTTAPMNGGVMAYNSRYFLGNFGNGGFHVIVYAELEEDTPYALFCQNFNSSGINLKVEKWY